MGLEAAAGLLSCPHCRAPLNLAGPVMRCPQGHSYDVARQGYVNLLEGPEPANADTPGMLAARARVLAAGVFEPLAEVLAASGRGPRLLEVGSGTAYYLRACLGSDAAACGIALDVSRAAARIAARLDRRIAAVVADVWRPLPVSDHCVDTVLAVFAPRNLAEFARVLAPGGRLLVATPEPGHLAGLRELYGLLDLQPDKAGRVAAAAAEYFRPTATHLVRRQVRLDAGLVADLIGMGPNAFHRAATPVEAAVVQLDLRVQVLTPLV